MRSLVFRTAAAALLPLMLLLSVVVLLRGHNEPGGGFVGGLVAASAFALYALAHRERNARRLLPASPITLIGIGLLIAAASGLPGLFAGEDFMKGLWASIPVPGFEDAIKIGTPLFFDIGVYILVMGGTLLMILTLEEVGDATAPRG